MVVRIALVGVFVPLAVLALSAIAFSEDAKCKAYGDGPCCDRTVIRHLSRQSVYAACKEGSDTYLGEVGGTIKTASGEAASCRYVFRPKPPGSPSKPSKPSEAKPQGQGQNQGQNDDGDDAPTGPEGFVELSAPAQTDVPEEPQDPFFSWSKVAGGKAFVALRGKTPQARALLESTTGIWLPGKDFIVSVTASTSVCSRGEALKLAKSVR
jgi:hypothetical protein